MHSMPIEGFELTKLRLLAALSELRHLSAAARRIGLSQSTASHALKRLRAQLGDPLFVRAAGGVYPTPYGEKLGTAARQALEILSAGLTASQPFDPGATMRRFSIYLSTVGQVVLLPRIPRLHARREAPGASLLVRSVPVDNPGTALAVGEIDLAVGYFNNLTTGFHQSTLLQEHLACIVRADHPLFHEGMSREAFLAAPHAVADASGMAYAAIDRALARRKIRRHTMLVVPEFAVLPLLVASSDLLVIMPARLAEASSSPDAVPIRIFPPPIPMPSFAIKVYWHERFHHDAANQWLRRAFVNLFRDGEWSQEPDPPVSPH